MEKQKHEAKGSVFREILSWILPFLFALAVTWLLKNYIIINADVPTGSMENAIMPGDRLIGNRLAYLKDDPMRGDIIIFKYPDNEEELYVKRIVGLPGETVEIRQGEIYINGSEQPLHEDGDIIIFKYPDNEEELYVKRIVGLPGETVEIRQGEIYINGSEQPLHEDYLKERWTVATGDYYFEIPEDSYLVLGDNRNDSWDARYWTNTYVHKDKILGQAVFVYWPFQNMGRLR